MLSEDDSCEEPGLFALSNLIVSGFQRKLSMIDYHRNINKIFTMSQEDLSLTLRRVGLCVHLGLAQLKICLHVYMGAFGETA
jgi:hypothetical protein